MKNFKKREYNSLDGTLLKNHNVSKKRKANVLAYENQMPIDWHEVKIILDATVVEKYLNDRKSGKTVSPSHRENILVQKIPRPNQNVFSESSSAMVILDISENTQVDDNLLPEDSLVSDDVPDKQEDCISVPDKEFTKPLREDSQIQDPDNFAVGVALKNEVIESNYGYEEVIIYQELKDELLKSEVLFVGEEFKHEEFVPIYENVDSINEENNEELNPNSTRSSRKSKKSLGSHYCCDRLAKKPRVTPHNKVVTPKILSNEPKSCSGKSRKPSKPRKSKQESLQIASPSAISKPRKADNCNIYCDHCHYKSRCRDYLVKHLKRKHPYLFFTELRQTPTLSKSATNILLHRFNIESIPERSKYRVYHCDHCNYNGLRGSFMTHFRRKHAHEVFNDSIWCPNCDMQFDTREEMQRHRYVCLLFLICKFCFDDVPTKKAMVNHVRSAHPQKIDLEEDGKILELELEEVYRCSMEGAVKTLKLTPFGQRYMEIKKYYLEIESDLVKFYCTECAVTRDNFMSRTAPRCDDCNTQLLFQCQKCKSTRNCYSYIWRHLTNKNSYCSISGRLPFMGHEESSNAADQASSNEAKRNDCEICDFKGTTRTQLYEHVLNVHLDVGIMKNSIADRIPCRFCPTTRLDTRSLSNHITTVHFDELDGRDVNEFMKEAVNFRRMVKGVNRETFNNRLRYGTAKIGIEDFYHEGIKGMLKPFCIECKKDGPPDREYCTRCHGRLSFVCLKCDELFFEYPGAWDHATRMCENRIFTLTVGGTL